MTGTRVIRLRCASARGRATVQEVSAEPLGRNVYRLGETPLFLEGDDDGAETMLRLGDVVEVAPAAGELTVVRVLEQAPLRSSVWLLGARRAGSPAIAAFCAQVLRAGGFWERPYDDVLIVHLPRGCPFDPEAALDRALSSVPPAGAVQ